MSRQSWLLGRVKDLISNVRSDFAVLVLIGILVGLGSGLAGIALHLGIRYFSVGAFGTSGTVLGIFLPALGAGLSWHLLNRVTHYEGRGIADVIWSAHREGGRMPKEAMFSQMAWTLARNARGVLGRSGPGGSRRSMLFGVRAVPGWHEGIADAGQVGGGRIACPCCGHGRSSRRRGFGRVVERGTCPWRKEGRGARAGGIVVYRGRVMVVRP